MHDLKRKILHSFSLCLLFTLGCGAQQPGDLLPDLDVIRPIEMPSPPILEAEAFLQNETLTIKGQVRREGEDTDVSGVTVTFKNALINQQEQIVVNAEGSFDITLTATPGALIIGKAVDPKTEQTSNVLKTVLPYVDASPPIGPQDVAPQEEGLGLSGEAAAPSPLSLEFSDAALSDYDGDGVSDAQDDCPADRTGSLDPDGDGLCTE